ncbi:hypothetical protein [Nannocystis bainbridge]|uniref:MAM domain-containing protein n=1 Tax=Nannocystis bainbridge TaxID=2995303 RepID=A0ABT5DXN3_9BACT|nr:hypothetical protein [Nannocystis bainbridge]MDC0718320.1 hypothetical protein [Nannocystis bainbridge]
MRMRLCALRVILAGWALAGCRPVTYEFVDSASATEAVSETMSSGTDTALSEPPPAPVEPCFDGIINGAETDLDCGGPVCPPCGPGQQCSGPWDCAGGLCEAGLCRPPLQCRVAEDCPDEPCRQPQCDGGQCSYVELEGIKCDDGDLCTEANVCIAGACTGVPRDCSGHGGACQQGFCNPASGNCAIELLEDGAPCDDGLGCTFDDFCAGGQCFGKPGLPILFADFTDPGTWLTDPPWMIGPAKPSACAFNGLEDPAEDHSPGDDNMLAGAAIGGCLPDEPLPMDACLTSPPIELQEGPEPLLLHYWSQISLVPLPPRLPASARVDVWTGKEWLAVFESKNEPFEDPEWTPHAIDITPFRNPGLMVRFCHHHPEPGLPPIAGWSVDDVFIGPPDCQPP